MTAITVPSLSGLARMLPVTIDGAHNNTGADPRNTEYTVPDGKIALITHLSTRQMGGAAYGRLFFNLPVGAGATDRMIFETATPAVFVTLEWTGTLWLGEGRILQSGAAGGGADSDYQVAGFGVVFDWVDVT